MIVGMTGATGTIIAVRVLQMLQDAGVETHLVMSKWAVRTLLHETPYRSEMSNGWPPVYTRWAIRAPQSRADRSSPTA